MESLAETLARQRYAVWTSVISDPELSLLYRYACKRVDAGTMNMKDPLVPGTPSAGKDFMMDRLLNDLVPAVEHACGLKVVPTYSYFRVYRRGDILPKHSDRPSCEISLSLCLGYSAARPWPIWIEGPHGVAKIGLEPGDALLYRGIECPHWREAFDGKHIAQVFLHYVDEHGPNAEWKFDKRPSLAAFPVRKD